MTAIPEGVYVVTVSFSARFQRLLPDVHDVPNFTGVRIHSGNTDADTEGCILVGQTTAPDFVGNSRAAFNRLFTQIQAAAQREKILLEVTSTRSAARGLRGVSSRGAGFRRVTTAGSLESGAVVCWVSASRPAAAQVSKALEANETLRACNKTFET
jgi:Family of unknown function (DUF5675)